MDLSSNIEQLDSGYLSIVIDEIVNPDNTLDKSSGHF